MSTWLIIGLLAAGFLQSVPKQTDKPNANKDNGAQVPNPTPKLALESSSPLTGPSTTEEQNSTNGEAKQPSWCEKLLAPILANWPLIAVAIWGILVARGTLKVIARQAVSMRRQTTILRKSVHVARKGANAALLNAQAVINSERAWIVAELIPMARSFGQAGWARQAGTGWAILNDEEVISGEHLKHKLRFTNMGRTPAMLLRYELCHSVLDKNGVELPSHDIVKAIEIPEFNHALPSGESTEVMDVDVFNVAGDAIGEDRDRADVVVFHGFVEYLHVFDDMDVQTATFRYPYNPKTMQLYRDAQRGFKHQTKKQDQSRGTTH